MKNDSGKTISSWMATSDEVVTGSLTQNLSADVCIVGAGIAGLSTAYELQREGKSVVVLDRGVVGGGMTSRTTAHLVNVLDDRYFKLERLHGTEGARLAAASHTTAVDRIEEIVEREKIKCDFERLDGYLFVPPREPKKLLDEELAALMRAGLTSVEKVERVPLADYNTGAALRFPRQAQFHPLKYLAGLVEVIKRNGGSIYSSAPVESVTGGKAAKVKTRGGPEVRCDAIVVATNTPINDLVAIHTKQAPYQTYVIAARVARGAVPKALFWDTGEPYHYVRLQHVGRGANAYDLLIVGGEDHKTGQANDARKRFGRLERWARVRFPSMERVEFRWSGEVLEPVDGLAFIGRNPLDAANVYVATGDSGNGMTHGVIAGILLTDLIMGRENPWASLYDPGRISLRAFGDFAKENLNVAVQYMDYIRPGDVSSTDDIRPGSGAVVLKHGGRVAAFRDEAGVLHERSAVCRHLGCIVNWNGLEQSWDCPCHGSRYDAYGRVMQGPANSDLPPIEDPAVNQIQQKPRSAKRRYPTRPMATPAWKAPKN